MDIGECIYNHISNELVLVEDLTLSELTIFNTFQSKLGQPLDI